MNKSLLPLERNSKDVQSELNKLYDERKGINLKIKHMEKIVDQELE